MIQHLIFTCPECASHELLRADRTMAYRKDRSVLCKEGKYLPGESELIELEPRGLAGLRCAQCGFPDSKMSSTFEWKSWKDVASNGCLSPDPDYGKEKVACAVCSLDGRFYRTYALLKPGRKNASRSSAGYSTDAEALSSASGIRSRRCCKHLRQSIIRFVPGVDSFSWPEFPIYLSEFAIGNMWVNPVLFRARCGQRKTA